MDISLVIPAFNEEKWIGTTLEAVIKNAPGAFKEIVVVDNASTDSTAEVAGSFPGVRLIRENRKGTNYARNAGVAATTAELVAFLDADTLMRESWVRKVKRAFANDPRLVCLTGPYWFYDVPRYQALLLWINWHFALVPHFFTSAMGVTGNMVLKRDVLDRMGGFNTAFTFSGDDVDTALRASRFGRVRFTFSIILDSSGRRYKNFGFIDTILFYNENAFRVLFGMKKRDDADVVEIR